MKDRVISFFFIFWVCLAQNLEAYTIPPLEIEAKVSAFFPTSNIIRHIYDDVIPMYDLELHQSFCEIYQWWLGVGYLGTYGESLGLHNKTTLKLVPVSLGLKFDYPMNKHTRFQAGIGGCWSFLRINDSTRYLRKQTSKNALGGTFRLGLVYQITERFYADIFGEYFHQRFTFSKQYKNDSTIRNNVDLSGLKAGLGVVLKF